MSSQGDGLGDIKAGHHLSPKQAGAMIKISECGAELDYYVTAPSRGRKPASPRKRADSPETPDISGNGKRRQIFVFIGIRRSAHPN